MKVHRSTILSPATRYVWIEPILNALPDGGAPMNGPLCVPVSSSRQTTKSSSPVRSAIVSLKSGNASKYAPSDRL